ncbi:type III-A CRISPR-associated RAMP protein Csm5 [filamentous cyanobacterium CCP1]|nr:type III-A CRISPR-associated RAMP protein Csm5 [filamentous cyanobacterium CCP2]PSB67764.1 type III-A CRISPR-associated RAMP protein Csm5 [filamentous cyanobacterium CCP1]
MTEPSKLTLKKPDVYETKQIRLTSPLLHIGGAVQQLYPFEYVATSNRVYLPNQDALAKALKQRGRLQDYLQKIADREDITPLLRQVFGDDWQTAKDDLEKPIFPQETSSRRWTDQSLSQIRPMIRNGLGQPYIPGSSIKGAIRTAIAYYLLKHADRCNVPPAQKISEIEQKLRQSIGNLKREAKKADDLLFMDTLFTDFELTNPKHSIHPSSYKKGPNTDLMRAVQITDTESILEEQIERGKRKSLRNSSVLAEVIVSSRFPEGRAKYRSPIYAEMLCNVRTTFTISLDIEMLSWFRHTQGMQIPFYSIQEILEICQEFAQEQWDFEHDYWNEIENNPNANGKNLDFSEIRHLYEPEKSPYSLRMGWASGIPGTTINTLLSDDLREMIRDTCGIKAPGFEAPKSRRTVVSSKGEIRYAPGWVKFEVLN